MKTDDLISKLSSDLSPVRPGSSRRVWWTYFAIACVFTVVFCLVGLLSPQNEVSGRVSWTLILSALALGLELFSRFIFPAAGVSWPPAALSAVHCAVSVVAASLLLSTVFIALARAGATTRFAGVGILSAIASVGLSSFVVNLACPNENPIHLLLSHFLIPTLLAVTVSGLAARRVLKW